MSEIAGLITGIKGAIDAVKGLKAAYDAHTFAQAQVDILKDLITVQSGVLALQDELAATKQEKAELTKQLLSLEDWNLTKNQYILEEICAGSFVYSPNQSNQSSQPRHWLCTNCFDNKKQKSILQLSETSNTKIDTYKCPNCGATIKDSRNYQPLRPRVGRI